MHQIAFHQLPLWIRVAAALTLLNTWVLIAEFGIDRYGLDEYLPFYRYGNLCVWDVAVLIGVAVLFVRSSRVRSSSDSDLDPAPPEERSR